MSYLVLARKYRPQKFSDLTGQETTAKILQAAITQDRVAPAYLLSGPRGIGKTTSARIFAKALNCKNPKNAEPCDACASCEEIAKSASMDVLELDAASHTGVDNIREVIINTVSYAPVRDKFKVFIIDEVHMLSAASFNALLKTLEEPPPHVVFILATTEYHKLPATIVSRCQRFRFLPLTQKEIGQTLKNIAAAEKIKIDDDAVALLARAAAGAMRDGLSLFDQAISQAGGTGETITLEKVEEILGVVREDFLADFLETIAAKDAKSALEAIGKLLNEGFDLSYFVKELREAYRQMLIEKSGYKEESGFSPRKKILPFEKFSLQELLRGSQLLSKCADAMRWNDFPRMIFECYAVKLCQEAIDVQDILDRLGKLEGGTPPARPRPVQTSASPKLPARPETSSAASAPSAAAPKPISEASDEESFSVPEAPAQSSDSDLGQVWKSVLMKVQQRKPSLSPVLESARPAWREGALELGFAKPFGLDTAKRNQPFIETLLSETLNKRVLVTLKVAEQKTPSQPASQRSAVASAEADSEPEADASSEDDDTVVVEQPHETYESMDRGEVFEMIDGDPSPIEDAIEDEGTKKFLSVFHGKVTRLPSP